MRVILYFTEPLEDEGKQKALSQFVYYFLEEEYSISRVGVFVNNIDFRCSGSISLDVLIDIYEGLDCLVGFVGVKLEKFGSMILKDDTDWSQYSNNISYSSLTQGGEEYGD